MSGQFNKTVNLIVLGSCWLDMMSCYLMMKLKLMIMISWGIRRVAVGGWLCFCVVCCGQLVAGGRCCCCCKELSLQLLVGGVVGVDVVAVDVAVADADANDAEV